MLQRKISVKSLAAITLRDPKRIELGVAHMKALIRDVGLQLDVIGAMRGGIYSPIVGPDCFARDARVLIIVQKTALCSRSPVLMFPLGRRISVLRVQIC